MFESQVVPSVRFRDVRGDVVADARRWFVEPTPEESEILRRMRGPVLDVGCGPGRHVAALHRRGIVAMGVDAMPAMVSIARERGATVHHGSVFDDLPGGRRWASALLLDGNIGIGGDPVALLSRIRSLLRPGGFVMVEVSSPGTATPVQTVHLEVDGEPGHPFAWATVAADELDEIARRCDLELAKRWRAVGRWFAELRA